MRVLFFFLFIIAFADKSISQNLVLRGDHADPSVVKIGDTYWATATSSNWFPAYPLLSSKDLVNWKMENYVFRQIPAWADYYFWAPEISYENSLKGTGPGKIYIYYAAHKKGGNLCLSVASADKPEGPYTDHGPLMCQEAGSIDAFPMRDEQGNLYIIWKEDGNSVNKPTPIWAQQINEERTALIGEKKELFRNDKSWEGNLVEGVSIIKNTGYYYAFYAAAACCGRECTYQTGVARSKSLLGPWEKYEKNPILSNNDQWKCPGHGTPIEKDGKYYFLYHAYHKTTDVYTGREGLLKEFKFTPDGWIEFINDVQGGDVAMTSVSDDFNGKVLSDNWQWSVFQPVNFEQTKGKLKLSAMPSPSGAYIGIRTISGNYNVTVKLSTKRTTAAAGLGVIGDDKNTVSVLFKDGVIKVSQLKDGKESEIFQKEIKVKRNLFLQMQVTNGKEISFMYSANGRDFQALNTNPVDGSFLPPWDRSLRVGLIAKGETYQNVVFDKFQLNNK